MTNTLHIRTLADNHPFEIEFSDSQNAPEYVGPHRHEYYEIFWVLEGKGSHSIDFIEYPLIPGRVYFITPGQVHEAHSVANSLFAISFNPDFVNPDYRSQLAIEQIFSQNSPSVPFVTMDAEGHQALRPILDLMITEVSREQADMDMLSALLTSFLRYLLRYNPQRESTAPQSDKRMVALLALIEESFKAHKETLFYSEQLALTSKRVNELTRQHFSKTVTQLVHDRIILEAKRDLAYTDKTIKAIALDLGFDDVTYFSRFFRRLSEVSPKAFREGMFK